MATGTGTLIELRLEPDGLSGRITCPDSLLPVPGQYLLASGPDPAEPLPVPLFPSEIKEGQLVAAAPIPASWTVGMTLRLRGPMGQGFKLPPTTRRLALASLEGTAARLLPLANRALEQNASVVIYSRAAPNSLPEEVEVLPLDLLPEATGWADFLALEAPVTALTGLAGRLGLLPYQRANCLIQVMVIAPMPCGGTAECGVCAVPTRAGWALACSDGPVFDLNELEGGL